MKKAMRRRASWLLLNHCALEVHRVFCWADWKSGLRFLHIERITSFLAFEVVFGVFLDHLGGDIARTADKVAPGPEVLAPVSFLQLRELHLQLPAGLALEVLYEGGDVGGGVDGDEDMYMIRSHCSREDLDVFLVADTAYEVFGSMTNIPFQHLVPVFGDPAQVQVDGE